MVAFLIIIGAIGFLFGGFFGSAVAIVAVAVAIVAVAVVAAILGSIE
jgi:hypothetical protein